MPETIKSIAGVITHDELPNISIYLVKMTPQAAQEILAHNAKGQRSISKVTVEKYASDMGTMDWQFNGAPVLISNKGELLDGQHRLTAIIESGISQILLVIHGVDAQAMATIDAGRGRSYADILKIREFANHGYLAGLTARVWQWWHGNYGVPNVARVANPQHLGSAPSNAQRDFWWEKVEATYEISLPLATTFGMTMTRKMDKAEFGGINPGTYSLAHVVLGTIDPYVRDQFFNELGDGPENAVTGNPVQALRNRLFRLRPREQFDNVDQLDALFTSYNAFVRGKDLGTISALRMVRYNTIATPIGWMEIEDYEQDKALKA